MGARQKITRPACGLLAVFDLPPATVGFPPRSRARAPARAVVEGPGPGQQKGGPLSKFAVRAYKFRSVPTSG